MPGKPAKAVSESPLEISVDINTVELEFYVLGTSPLLMNRMSEKAKRQLLLPDQDKNRAERATTLKHNPVEEFRAAVYRSRDTRSPALFHLPSGAFKDAIRSVATDIPGAFKAQIGRLVNVTSINIELFGKPELHMAVVKQAGITRAPDIRTRAVFPRWACRVRLSFVTPLMNHTTVTKLFAAAGVIIGVGDGRPEKGKLTYGQFAIVDQDDADWNDIVNTEGRAAQQAGMDTPICHDQEAEDMIVWFDSEIKRRQSAPEGTKVGKAAHRRKKNGADEDAEAGVLAGDGSEAGAEATA